MAAGAWPSPLPAYRAAAPHAGRGGIACDPGCDGLMGAAENSDAVVRSEEHTSELQSLMRNSSAVFCLTTQPKPSHPERHEQTKHTTGRHRQHSNNNHATQIK